MTQKNSKSRKCFWSKCSNHKRCDEFGSCVAIYQSAHKDELFAPIQSAAQGGGTEGETAAETYTRTGQPLFNTQWEREEYERSIGYVRPSDPPSQEASAPPIARGR